MFNMALSRQHISMLYLKQLHQLHTITFKGDMPHASVVKEDGLQSLSGIIQAGGLPSLRTLQGDYDELCKLAPCLGGRITELLVTVASKGLTQLASLWPALQRVQLSGRPSSAAVAAEVYESVCSHRTITHIAAPIQFLTTGSVPLNSSWEVMKVTLDGLLESREITVPQLADMPLKGVQHLQLPCNISRDFAGDSNELAAAAAAQNLRTCGRVTLLPSQSGLDFVQVFGVPTSMPAYNIALHPEPAARLFHSCPDMKGALILGPFNASDANQDYSDWHDASSRDQNAELTGQKHLDTLHLIPEGVHTLVLEYWALEDDCSWSQVLASIPAHVHKLVFEECLVPEHAWLDMLEKPPPKGLHTVALAWETRINILRWAPCAGEELESMQALVAQKWPGVQLTVSWSP